MADPRLDGGPRPPQRRRRPKKTGGPAGQCLGRSRGGFGTKIHAAVSGLGLPVRLSLSPGQFGDPGQVPMLLGGLEPGTVIGDKGYDSGAVVERVRSVGARVVIPTQKNRTVQRDTDWHRYKDRNLVERFWAKAKQYRRVATRYEKTARNFMAFVHVAAVMILLQ